MDVYYAVEQLPSDAGPSIFLAGPTPRSDQVQSWRPNALRLLERAHFTGAVFVPECREGGWHGDYDAQVRWEWSGLALARCVLFWVPRAHETLPGFTTNIELGFCCALKAASVVLGFPEEAAKMRYPATLAGELRTFAQTFGIPLGPVDEIPVHNSLELTVIKAVSVASQVSSPRVP